MLFIMQLLIEKLNDLYKEKNLSTTNCNVIKNHVETLLNKLEIDKFNKNRSLQKVDIELIKLNKYENPRYEDYIAKERYVVREHSGIINLNGKSMKLSYKEFDDDEGLSSFLHADSHLIVKQADNVYYYANNVDKLINKYNLDITPDFFLSLIAKSIGIDHTYHIEELCYYKGLSDTKKIIMFDNMVMGTPQIIDPPESESHSDSDDN